MSQSTATVEDEDERREGVAVEGKPDSHGATMAAITRRFVALLKEHYGKGPTNARTYHMDDVVVVLLGGGYTPVERTLLEDGQEEAVHAQREAFQDAMRPRFQRVIEEEMRREVIAFMSTVHAEPDYNAELFVLAPEER